ncbi:MAG: hypothetical protein M1821_001480 [Bathelium mastoideum]|nr:MAG: hypothetical protein M1821_001480 [Bathelium mastoideum]KAI9690009.1 MAG: hypothetical protein M1822_009891 [Bathelium mastoideum]
MAQSQPTALPLFYGEKSKDGSAVPRPSEDEGEALLRPNEPQPPDEVRLGKDRREVSTIGPLAWDGTPDEPAGRRSESRRPNNEVMRWMPNQNYGRPWDDRRSYYGNYRSPYSRDEFDEADYELRPRHSSRRSAPPVSLSRYGSARGPPRRAYNRPLPPKSEYYSEDEFPDEEYVDDDAPDGAGGGRGGGHGRRPPRHDREPSEILRLPWTMWMNSDAKNHFVAIVGEFVGTTMFLFLAFAGTQVANIGATGDATTTTGQKTGFNPTVLLYVGVAFGFSLMVNVFIFFRVSGGLFNPAVSLAMAAVGAITPVRAFLLVIAQLCGAMFASELVKVLFPTPFNVRTTLSANTSLAQGVFIEALLTAELVFTIFMLAKEKHKATYLAPVGIGLALFVAELVGVYYTGGSLNPARSFGPCVVSRTFDSEHWIYWVGPGLGALISVFFYKFVKILEYETANPGADDNGQDVEEKAASPKVKSTV